MRLPSLLVLASLLLPDAARADHQFGNLGNLGDTLTTSATTFSPLTTTGAVVLVVVLTREQGAAAADDAEVARLYLRHNAVQLAQDLAIGDGPLVQELAVALKLRPQVRPDFVELLRSHRHALADLADPDRLDRVRALAFVTRLKQLLAAHPVLQQDLARLASDA
jgi:hypothetical protein